MFISIEKEMQIYPVSNVILEAIFTILVSGTRQIKDDFIYGAACSITESPVLEGDQPNVFKRPAAM